MKNRLISVLLIIALAVMLLPQAAFMAADPECAHEHTVQQSETIGFSRGDFCYMLWRMAGQPESGLELALEDVSAADYRYPAYLWAVDQKIMTYDKDRNRFLPDEPLVRGSAVEFLWRYAGSPEPAAAQAPFSDVLEGARYNKAVRWATEAGWIELNPEGSFFRGGRYIGRITLDCTVCEDCGEITQISKLSFSEPMIACGTYGDNLTWTLGNGLLTIEGSGEMADMDAEQVPWYPHRHEIRRVSLPAGLTSIGSAAFMDSSLEEVILPEGIRRIGARSFAHCYSLGYASIPDSVTDIGVAAFLGCPKLTISELPPQLRTIGDLAFIECESMDLSGIPASVEQIGPHAFTGSGVDLDDSNWQNGILYSDGWALESKNGITSAAIRAGTKKLADKLFYGCSDLKEASIPGEVTEISPWMFGYCEKLKEIEIPANVTRIGQNALCGIGKPSKVTIVNRECVIEKDEKDPASALGWPTLTTVYGYKGSTAEKFAETYGYRFVPLSEKVPFVDVPEEAFFEDPVAWAVSEEVTKGVDATHFGPDDSCTRGQVVTFLWRAAGCPEPGSSETGFTDLKPGAFYEKAVAWAVENDITKGTSATSFSPDSPCTRGQIVTFLWRSKGKPAPKDGDTPFRDLKDGGFYLDAVAWAVESKVTNGQAEDRFGPDASCTRGQIVTFLYRAAGEK